MSMVMELIHAVTDAERQIDEQISQLRTIQTTLDQTGQKVETALSGSTQDYEHTMIQQLTATKKQIEETLGRLMSAKEKLEKVKMI